MWSILASKITVGILVFIIIMADVFLATNKLKGDTWSEIIRHWALYIPAIPFSFGYLMTHWFGLNPRGPFFGQPSSAILLAWLTIAISMIGFACHKLGISIHPLIMLSLGGVAGYFLWSGG
jgi:hypothetical protein